jgi:type I restriction enzyme S subunit
MEEGDIPVLGSTGIIGYHNKVKINPPGVITGRSGTIGLVQYTDKPYWPHNTSLWVKDYKLNHPKFVYYKLQTLNLNRFNAGASVPTLNRNNLDNLIIESPDIPTQKEIASILSTYDGLIDTNRRRIHLLEEVALLLFREWFVYLHFPGYKKVNIINNIPKGWEKLRVRDIIKTVNSRKKLQKSDYCKEGIYPCIDQSQDFIGGYTNKKDYLIIINTPIVVFGDHTRIIKYIDFPFVSGADGTQLLISKKNSITSEFLYFILKNINLSNYFYARHFKFLKEQWVLVPDKDLSLRFNQYSLKIMRQISILRKINQKLTQVRGLLLPRLMNGTIKV